MKIPIVVFGFFILFAGMVLTVHPAVILDFIAGNKEAAWVYYAAIGVRMIIGMMFVATAYLSRYPLTVKVFGYLFIAVSLLFVFAGHRRFVQLLNTVIDIFAPYAVISGILAIVFGGFIIYAYTKPGKR